MVHHKKLVFILAIGFILMSCFSFAYLLRPDLFSKVVSVTSAPTQENTNANVQSNKLTQVALGQPCDDLTAENMKDTHGYQCFFYGGSPSEGSRPGIWIQPDPKDFTFSALLSQPIAWTDFTDPDSGITIPVMNGMKATQTSKDEGGVTDQIEYNDELVMTIEKVVKNGVSMEDRLKEDTQGFTGVNDTVGLNPTAQDVRHVVVYSKTNLTNPVSVWAIDEGDYYYYIRAEIVDDSLIHYAVEYMITNIKINK